MPKPGVRQPMRSVNFWIHNRFGRQRVQLPESTVDRLGLVDSCIKAQMEGTNVLRYSMAGLRASIASDEQRSGQDINPGKSEEKGSVTGVAFKTMIEMMKQVPKSNTAIMKKLDSIETTQKQLEAHIKALKPRPPVCAASSNGAGPYALPLSAAPKGKYAGAASVSPVLHSTTWPPPAYHHSPASPSRSEASPLTKTPATKTHEALPSSFCPKPAYEATSPPGADMKSRLTLKQTEWLNALEVCIQNATKKRESDHKYTFSSDISDRAKRFLRWYFPRHGCDHHSFEKTNVVVSGKGTLDEEWIWDIKLKLGGKVVWKTTTQYCNLGQAHATVDLARGVVALDPQGWKDFSSQDLH